MYIRRVAAISIAVVACSASSALAALVVDPAQTITRQVTVQLIRTALDNGSSPATVFGNAAQRAFIEAGIDRIWAQAGIDIKFEPNVRQYNNTFAYQGNNGGGTRDEDDFDTIFTNAAGAGVLSADPKLNLLMVNVVPFFAPLSEDSSAGLARTPGNGIIGYVGDNLLAFNDGLDGIASVMAHEIGHNLGLTHMGANTANLMALKDGTAEKLTPAQISTARSSGFAPLYNPPASLTGDYNSNGVVDAADYVVWRNSGTGSYSEWRSNFGRTLGTGASDTGALLAGGAVPEPALAAYLLIVSTALFVIRGSRRNR